MQKIHSFTGLKAWQESHHLVLALYSATQNFPSSELYGLTNQVRRAAVSISSNIAEGFSRTSRKEKIQFYCTALSSLTEIQNQILVARDIGYLDLDNFKKIADQTVLASKLINGLMKSAQNRPPRNT